MTFASAGTQLRKASTTQPTCGVTTTLIERVTRFVRAITSKQCKWKATGDQS